MSDQNKPTTDTSEASKHEFPVCPSCGKRHRPAELGPELRRLLDVAAKPSSRSEIIDAVMDAMVVATIELIQEAKQVPSGQLYMMIQGATGMPLGAYQALVQLMVDTGRIRVQNNLLIYVEAN